MLSGIVVYVIVVTAAGGFVSELNAFVPFYHASFIWRTEFIYFIFYTQILQLKNCFDYW